MNEEAMLLEAILTEPDDHVHRLVFADWLNERDDAREALVRAQGALGPSRRTLLNGKLGPAPAGTFVMGSPEGAPRRDPDEAAHEVELTRAFYVGATPVTVREYRTFVSVSGYQTRAEGSAGVGWNAEARMWEMGDGYSWRSPGWKQTDDDPVVCLAWEDAVAFCEWLAEDGQPYRLPSEAEWEYACRG